MAQSSLFQALVTQFGNRQELDALSSVVTGGCDCMVSGAADLQSYGESSFIKGKERLIRDLAKFTWLALKLPNANYMDSAPIEKVVDMLRDKLPARGSKRDFSDDFKSSSGKQSAVIDALAAGVNHVYGSNLIPDSDSPGVKAGKVSEVVNSLLQGLKSEFLSVAGDLERVLRNIEKVDGFLDAAWKKQQDNIQASGDQVLREQAEATNSVYQTLKAELRRQLALVSNALGVVAGPSGKSIVALLEESEEFRGLVHDLGADVGSRGFAEKLSLLFSGVNNVAYVADKINKALATIGLSVSDFRKAKTPDDLHAMVYDAIAQKKPNSDQMIKLAAAAKVIYNTTYNKEEIDDLLSSGKLPSPKNGISSMDEAKALGGDPDERDDLMSSAAGHMDADAAPVEGADDTVSYNVDDVWGAYDGGDDDVPEDPCPDPAARGPAYWNRRTLSKKLERQKKARDLLMNDFKKRLQLQYRALVNAAMPVANAVGNEIRNSEALDRFIMAFESIPQINRSTLHKVLTGYYKDATTKEQRSEFLNKLHMVIELAEPLEKGPGGEAVRDLVREIQTLVSIVDEFNDRFVRALTEIHIESPLEAKEAVRMELARHGATGGADGGASATELESAFVSFNHVKTNMKYHKQISTIKQDLMRTADDIESYSTDYKDLVGREGAWMIDQIKRDFNARIEEANVGFQIVNAVAVPNAISAVDRGYRSLRVANGITAAGNAQAQKDCREAYQCFLGKQRDAKVHMVELAQSVDLYLQAFSNGIAKYPDQVGDVVRMLDQVEFVLKWFNEKSGDNLAMFFDGCPSSSLAAGDNRNYNTEGASITLVGMANNENKHYFEQVAARPAAAAAPAALPALNPQDRPGNPFIAHPFQSKKQLDMCLKLSDKCVKSVRAMENLLSVFSSIGSKFGNIDPQAASFMNSGQMFNVLCEYISVSSFATNYLLAGANNAVGQHELSNLLNAGGAANEANVNDTRILAGESAFGGSLGLGVALSSIPLMPSGNAAVTGVAARVTVANATVPAEVVGGAPNPLAQRYIDNYNNRDTPENADPQIRLEQSGFENSMFDTDNLFEMTLKSIVAKVLTVVDAYRLFNRPSKKHMLTGSLSAIRTILGGGSLRPQIIPEAMPLYYRLILLLEWYRDKFEMDKVVGVVNAANEEDFVLTIAPAIDGIWSDLFAIIFDKAKAVENGTYSDSQIADIIIAINSIFKAYREKSQEYSVRNVILACVTEVNRLYGFLKRKEIKSYLDARRNIYNGGPGLGLAEADSVADFDILNAKNQLGRNAAPSDRYLTVPNLGDGRAAQQLKSLHMIELHQRIKEFRERIDADLRGALNDDGVTANVSFTDMLRQIQTELNAAGNDDAQFEIVARSLKGVGRNTNVIVEKMLLVHEMVAAPLAALYGVYRQLDAYNSFMHGCSTEVFAELYGNNFAAAAAVVAPAAAAGLQSCQIAAGAGAGRAGAAGTVDQCLLGVLQALHPYAKAPQLQRMTAAANRQNANVLGTPVFGAGARYIVNPAGSLHVNADFRVHVLLYDIISYMTSIDADLNGLVSVQFRSDGSPAVDWSKLESLLMEVYNQIQSNINVLRPIVLSGELGKYENLTTVGSTRWLEENLIELLLKSRDKTGLPETNEHLGLTWQAIINRQLAQSARADDAKLRAAGVVGPAWPALNAAGGNGQQLSDCASYERVLAKLIYYGNNFPQLGSAYNNFRRFPFNVQCLAPILGDPSKDQIEALNKFATEPDVIVNVGGGVGPRYAPPVPTADVKGMLNIPAVFTGIYYNGLDASVDSQASGLGLMFTLNRLIANLVSESIDESPSPKILYSLIEGPSNNVCASAVMRGKGFPDIVELGNGRPVPPNAAVAADAQPAVAANIRLSHPEDDSVLLASLANVMRHLLVNRDKRTKKLIHEMEPGELPEYMRDRLKALLPYTHKMLKAVSKKANFLAKCITLGHLKVEQVHAPGAVADDNDWQASNAQSQSLVANQLDGHMSNVQQQLAATPANGRDMRDVLRGLLARITDVADAFAASSMDTYKTLQDIPLYMEVHKGSLKALRDNQSEIFTPLSNITWIFNGFERQVAAAPAGDNASILGCHAGNNARLANRTYSLIGLPQYAVDSSVQRFNYGCRLVLGRSDVDISMEHMPTTAAILNSFNKLHADNRFEASAFARTATLLVKLCRYAFDKIVFGRLQGGPEASGKFDVREAFGADENTRGMPAAFGAGQRYPDAAAWRNDQPVPFQLNASASHANSVRLKLIVNAAEGHDLQSSKVLIAAAVGAHENQGVGLSRKQLRTSNIMDLNIVPINVHAMAREVPFININNYAYTFDRMVNDYLRKGAAPPAGEAQNTRDLLVKLLQNPMAPLSVTEFYQHLRDYVSGASSLDVGRPKYLSDQLWGKALLQLHFAGDFRAPAELARFGLHEGGPAAAALVTGLRAFDADGSLAVIPAGPRAGQPVGPGPLNTERLAYYDSSTGERRFAPAPGAGVQRNAAGVVQRNAAGVMLQPQFAANNVNANAVMHVQYLQELGRNRFDTKIVRVLTWLVNAQRLVRLVLKSHMVRITGPVTRGVKLLADSNTEFRANEQLESNDFEDDYNELNNNY